MTDEGEDIGVTGTVAREAWRARTMPPVEKLRGDLWSIPVVIPGSLLRYTSVYVLAGTSGLTLIDTGTDCAEGWAALTDGLAELGATVRDVTGCLVTHFHYDHLGLASRLQSESGAWVGMHPSDLETVTRPEFTDGEIALVEGHRWLLRLGASAEVAEDLKEAVAAPGHRSALRHADRLVEDGDRIELDGWSLRAIHTPGHTPGHLCFLDERTRTFFAGDHILPRISPNVSGDRRDTDPLGDYLTSLNKVRDLVVDEVLPAHEWRFTDLRARVGQLERHHEERLAELLEVVRANPRSVPWDLAGGLTWSRPWASYDGHMRLSAVGETVSHLAHLVRRGQVLVSDEPVPRYLAADPTW